MILIFDTETSGLPNKSLPLDDPNQARIVQLACLLVDENFKEVAAFHSLIKPTGWTIHPKAFQAHGISMQDCEKYGIPIETALPIYSAMLQRSSCCVAHNIKFDLELISIEEQIAHILPPSSLVIRQNFCTMLAMTPVCKLPNFYSGQFKWPKLSEAYMCAFNEELTGAHDAMVDVRATARLFKWLVDNKLVVLPELAVV